MRSKQYLEDLTGKAVRGYRAPCFSITEWAIPILQEVGFDYNSSAVPTVAHDRYGRLNGMHAGRPIVLLRDGFYEACISCIRIGKRGIPWGGGGYFRLIPYPVWFQGVRTILRSGKALHLLHPPVGDRSGQQPHGAEIDYMDFANASTFIDAKSASPRLLALSNGCRSAI